MNTLSIPSIHYLTIAPVLVLFGASLTLLIAAAMWRRAVPLVASTSLSVLSAVAVLVVTYFQWRNLDHGGPTTTVAHAVVLDGFSVVATAIIAVSLGLAALLATTGRCARTCAVPSTRSWLWRRVRGQYS